MPGKGLTLTLTLTLILSMPGEESRGEIVEERILGE